MVPVKPLPSHPRFAIATASYRGDLERCRLLCASIDHFVSGLSTHYIMVEDADLTLFASLAGPKRRIVPESALFPAWLKAYPDPLSGGRRRVWSGAGALLRGVPPLRGWHTQQLRKLALPGHIADEVILIADSDSIFLKPFTLESQLMGGAPRLYCKPAAITGAMPDHVRWARSAARVLGTPEPSLPADDFINNMPTWRRDVALSLLTHIETVAARDWISTVARQRAFSEMLIYGQYCTQVLGSACGHTPTAVELTRTYWTADEVRRLGVSLHGGWTAPGQVSIGVQSFIGVPVEDLWQLFRQAASQP